MAKKKPAKKSSASTGFEIEFKQSAYFIASMKTLAKWCEDMVMKPDAKNLTIEAADASNTAMVQIIIPKSKFERYIIGKEHSQLVVSFTDFRKVMERGYNEDILNLKYDYPQQKLITKFKRDTGRTRTFRLAALEEEYKDLEFAKIRKTEFPIMFNIDPKVFEDILKDAEIYGETITIFTQSDDTDIGFKGEAPIGDFEGVLGTEELTNLIIEKGGLTTLAIGKLKKVLDLKSLTEELTVNTGHNYPIILIFTLKNKMEILYAQAPRVDQEEFDEIEDIKEAIEENINGEADEIIEEEEVIEEVEE